MNAVRKDITQRALMMEHYTQVRQSTLHRASPLSAEDQALQSMPDASPTKWHLGHTTWFVEKFVLDPFIASYGSISRNHDILFNSYYESLGARTARSERGLLSRPSLSDVLDYRRGVDDAVLTLIDGAAEEALTAIEWALRLAISHEEQHQELILTDILHAFSRHPDLPTYGSWPEPYLMKDAQAARWIEHPGGLVSIGTKPRITRFTYDNESPSHQVNLSPFGISDRLVTCGEYAEFIADGGYEDPKYWLSDGWHLVQTEGWESPIYWLRGDDPRVAVGSKHDWHVFGLSGVALLQAFTPVTNLSFFEADAYARWKGARLPTEFEWESAALLRGMDQLVGHAWQWTRSSYDPYPGFKPWPGMASEYNAKFMSGQMVLRGSSTATPLGHSRLTYRNYFPPKSRWQFSGIRLARLD